MKQKRICVVLSGAGISAESGLQTFRGPDGLWEGQRLEEVATPVAWRRDPENVLRFYNWRRAQVRAAQPNAAHRALVDLEAGYDVRIITQNIDDLHERAGSSNILHLHGEVRLARSTRDPSILVPLGDKDIQMGDTCPLGSQLRPHVVWFGEDVPAMTEAFRLAAKADVFIVVGTSLVVYPAASLVDWAPRDAAKYLVNPEIPPGSRLAGYTCMEEPAGTALPRLVRELLAPPEISTATAKAEG